MNGIKVKKNGREYVLVLSIRKKYVTLHIVNFKWKFLMGSKILRTIFGVFLVFTVQLINAQEMPLTIGMRFGANMSAQSINLDEMFVNVHESNVTWKGGYQVGVVVDLKLSRKVALQPGFFYKKSSYDYFVATINNSGKTMRMAKGEAGYSTYQIPIMILYKVGLSAIEWQLEAGPYIAFGAGGDNKLESTEIDASGNGIETKSYKYKIGFYDDSDGLIAGNDKFDWGIRIGTGVKILGKYYVGVHYNAGLRNVAKEHLDFKRKPSIKNRSVDFSIGYNF